MDFGALLDEQGGAFLQLGLHFDFCRVAAEKKKRPGGIVRRVIDCFKEKAGQGLGGFFEGLASVVPGLAGPEDENPFKFFQKGLGKGREDSGFLAGDVEHEKVALAQRGGPFRQERCKSSGLHGQGLEKLHPRIDLAQAADSKGRVEHRQAVTMESSLPYPTTNKRLH